MRVKCLLAFLLLIIFISGCVGQNGDQVTPKYSDNALKMEIKIREKEERRRILPGQTIRMVVTLTNQVENEIKNVNLKIINPYGVHISKVDCGDNCICEWKEGSDNPEPPRGCDEDVRTCTHNGCYYKSIQSLDEEEITYALKIPSEEEMSAMGRELKPKIEVEYDYDGESVLYIPIYKYGEKPEEPKKEFTQTTGPIHVDIDSDDWVRAGDLFQIYVEVKDVAHSTEMLTIYKDELEMYVEHVDIGSSVGKCEFTNETTHTYFIPKEDIILPLKNPLVCTLKAKDITIPMVKAPIIINYFYTYKVEKTETIRVEKALMGIF